MDSAESELLEEEELPEIKYIDSAEFQNFDNNADQREIQFRWMEAFETKEPRWFRLLDEFITPLSGKRGYCSRIVEKYARVLLHQGFELSQTDGPLRVAAIAASRDVGQAGNLPSVLNNLSEVTRHLNLAQYASTSLATVGQRKFANEVVQKTVNQERLGCFHLFLIGYREGLENLLSNHRHLRNFRYSAKKRHDLLTEHIKNIFQERDSFIQAPEASSFALQTVLENWTFPLQNEQIVQLAHANTLQMRALHVKGDGFYFLNEALNVAIAFNWSSSQEEMEEFYSIFTPQATNPRGKRIFQFWKMISKYDRSNGNAQGFLVTAQRLEEESKSDDIGAGCVTAVELACKIRNQCDQHEDLSVFRWIPEFHI